MDDKLSLTGAWSGHVTHYKILGAPIISLERLNKVVKFCTRVGCINSNNRVTLSPTKGACLWSHDCFEILPFVVMQRVARVCQRQLSYLFKMVDFKNLQIFNCWNGQEGGNASVCQISSKSLEPRRDYVIFNIMLVWLENAYPRPFLGVLGFLNMLGVNILNLCSL